MGEKEEFVISLSDIMNIVKKNILFIVLFSLLCSLSSFFITNFFIPKSYTATVLLYVDTSTDSEAPSNYNILSEQTYAQNLVATYIKMLNTNTFFSDLSKEINNKYSSSQLTKMISFMNDEKTEIFTASVTSDSPEDSKIIADAVGKIAPDAISRLKSKATLKIVDYAQLPTTPSAPNVKKYVILTFLGGLIISLAISFIKEFLDKKMRYSEDMISVGDIPILAAIPKFDSINNSNNKKG